MPTYSVPFSIPLNTPCASALRQDRQGHFGMVCADAAEARRVAIALLTDHRIASRITCPDRFRPDAWALSAPIQCDPTDPRTGQSRDVITVRTVDGPQASTFWVSSAPYFTIANWQALPEDITAVLEAHRGRLANTNGCTLADLGGTLYHEIDMQGAVRDAAVRAGADRGAQARAARRCIEQLLIANGILEENRPREVQSQR